MQYIMLYKVMSSRSSLTMKLVQSILLSVAYFVACALVSLPFILIWTDYVKANIEGIAGGPIEQLPIEIISATAALITVCLFGLKFRPVRVRDLGLGHRLGAQFAMAGAITGALLVTGTLATLYFIDVLTLNPNYRPQLTAELGALAAGVFANVVAQQIVFFGYMLTVIRKKTSAVVAVVTTSLLFLGAHAGVFTEPWPTWSITAANLFLAALMLSIAHLQSKTLWLGIGLHSGWNLMQALSNLAVTGTTIGVGAPPFILEGPAALTGDSVGIEGSMVSIPFVIIGIAIVVLVFRLEQGNGEASASHGP